MFTQAKQPNFRNSHIMKKICLLGATGSIGQNTIDIVSQFPEQFAIAALSSHSSIEQLFQLARKVRPQAAAFSGDAVAEHWLQEFRDLGVRLFIGPDALVQLVAEVEYDVLVNAVVGAAGLRPTLAAIRSGRTIALANKETLVCAGELVMSLAARHGVTIIPIDSEHSALWQCLVGESRTTVRRLILTASGGPFLDLPKSELAGVTVEQALKHPNWSMGAKITIDSSTLMNKGLEVIEAYWLFGIGPERISVVIHPQSIIHSMVEFIDGSIKAQMGLPDMRVPIQYALTYPDRLPNTLPGMDFVKYGTLTFFEPDFDKFRALRLAFDALESLGTAPAVLNAANEEAVNAFLQRHIRYDRIAHVVEMALNEYEHHEVSDLESVLTADAWARRFVLEARDSLT